MNNSIDNSVNENNNSSISHELQYLLSYKNSWSRQFSMKHPNKSIHTFTRPPLLEILSLLPIAYRVNSYLRTERKSLREPIFDLNGISMEPPNPGPYAGAPVGGIGTGAIGRGYKGEFKRYSLFPGRYVHRDIKANCFSVRIKNKELCYSKVLSTQKPDFLDTKIGNYHNNSDSYSNSHRNSHGNSNGSSQIHSCNDQYITDETCCTYYARFPISWTVYDNLLPGVKIIVKQLCPFLPNNYCESSLPVGVFDVQVEIDNSKFRSCRNNSDENSADTIEVSVLFCFQNGYDDEKDRTATCYSTEQFPAHSYFSSENRSTTQNSVNREKDTGVVHGIIMPNRREQFPCKDKATVNSFDVGSFSIATVEPSTSHSNMNSVGNDITTTVSFCRKIITGETMHKQSSAFTRAFERTCDWSTESTDETKSLRTTSTTATPLDTSPLSPSSQSSADDFSMNSIWRSFVDEGVLPESIENYDSKFLNSYKDKRLLYGSALCVKKVINILNANETIENGASSVHFVFGLSWDNPIARFGSNIGLPRFYTRFFGRSGFASSAIVTYALHNYERWLKHILDWQLSTLSIYSDSYMVDDTKSTNKTENNYYNYHIFNELYYLVDGGTIWTDSCDGVDNQLPSNNSSLTAITPNFDAPLSNSINRGNDSEKASITESNNFSMSKLIGIGLTSTNVELLTPLTEGLSCENEKFNQSVVDIQKLFQKSLSISSDSLEKLRVTMEEYNETIINCCGNQKVVGQFLYLEGHEYLMYNTYDVHFYASYALLMLWPQLELSLQNDIALSVSKEDLERRVMMGEGDVRVRKIKGAVPHDVGSPSEFPWRYPNAYNFQDVSRWKDLGPKFILQIYRNYVYMKQKDKWDSSNPANGMVSYLERLFPVCLQVMQQTEQNFDLDKDGMIENSGFPDQTYDIWIAKGVHAYCGGLWIAACEAMAAIAEELNVQLFCKDTEQQYLQVVYHYQKTAAKARLVYLEKLWNGKYLNYDSSDSSHHDSIMADMLAGQWYARACQLPPVIPSANALSCYRIIYSHNVRSFGLGKLIGAVNGTKYNELIDTKYKPYSGSKSNGDLVVKCQVDNSCMQSREVWTGTTYALAAGMMSEALHRSSDDDQLTQEERLELLQMASDTAQGIHDGGWQRFGYWFATPEGWEQNGNYRSLGYMRPLSIWAMQYAKEISKK